VDIVNVEEWDIEKPMPRQYLTVPQGLSLVPDVPNWPGTTTDARGRLAAAGALQGAQIPATTSINASVCDHYPRVAQAMLDAGWEFMGHGVRQGAMHLLPDQRAVIARRGTSCTVHGQSQGWLGPGPHRDVGDARLPGEAAPVRLRLGQRRPALRIRTTRGR